MRIYRSLNIGVPTDQRVKLKECEKRDKYMHRAREMKKKQWNMKVTIIPIVIGVLGTIPKRTGGLGNKRMSGDNPNYCIIEISQNTERSPRDMRILVVTQTPVRNHQLTLL